MPLLAFYGYLVYKYATDITYFGLLDNLNLLIHEAGHFVFMFFGEFINILGGTLLQLIMPLLFGGYFVLKKDWLAISFVLAWLATSLFHVATYVADAQEMALPMLIEGMTHDWNFLLIQTNLLEMDDSIAFVIRVIAWSCLMLAIALAGVELISKRPKGVEKKALPLSRLPVNFHYKSGLNASLSLPRKLKK